MKAPRFFSKLNYVYFFLFSIVFVRILVVYLDLSADELAASETYNFAFNFIGWFGVLYGVLLPLILIRVMDQLDKIDAEFDREAKAVRLLFEDISYLQARNSVVGKKLAKALRAYVVHVINHYPNEVKGGNTVKGIDNERIMGDEILEEIRKAHQKFLLLKKADTSDLRLIESDIYHEIRDLMEIRANRITFASQRFFEGFRLIALIVSVIFIVPFYIVGFGAGTSFITYILIISVTFLAIFIYMIIEDFNEPFGGTWKIDIESWDRVLEYIDSQEAVVTPKVKRKNKLK